MAATQSADIFGFRKITKKGLLESCKKNKLYRTPALNDVLYLHYQGFEDIECLEEYTGLKCIWLECNAISKISGLDNQKLLKCLFLHNNVVKKIENLEYCAELDTINLSHNHISKIENCGIDKLPVLTSLNLSHNYLRTYDNLVNLVDCKMISVLDLANNRIDDILCIKIFAQMPELRVLVLQGNPVVNQIPQYRKTLILDCVNLTYLDSRPVFARDRACAVAWKQGGYEAERIEHARWNREERKKIRQSVNATLRLKNRGGGDPQAQLLMSSDDEDAGTTELTSAPSLEKDQINKTDSSSQLVKSSDDEDSEDDGIQSIPLFKMMQEKKHCNSLFNTEKRCLVCSRLNCNDEHIKKRKRIWITEEPETILENSFMFNLTDESYTATLNNNDFEENNKLYNEVYIKNIQYINEVVTTNKNNNNADDDLNTNQSTVNITPNSPAFYDTADIAELSNGNNENKAEKFENLNQLLVPNHEQDSDITDFSSAPPMKKCKLNIEEEPPFNTDNPCQISSQYNVCEEPIRKFKLQETKNIEVVPSFTTDELFPISSDCNLIEEPMSISKLEETEQQNSIENLCNSNSDVLISNRETDNNLTTKNISYEDIYKTNNHQYISDIGENQVNDSGFENKLEIINIERTNFNLSPFDITNIETCIFDMKSKENIKLDAEVDSKSNNAENINNVTGESLKIISNKVQQLIDYNSSLNLINELPPIFSSKLYLGTDTKMNSAIALYEMSHKNDYNSENESDEIENIRNDNESIAIDTDFVFEKLGSKIDIIDRLLKDPITKTFKYDSLKIKEEFELLKDNDTECHNLRLKTFINNQNSKIEIKNQSDSVQVSKSEEILQNNSNTDDDQGKNMIETHSSDTRIIKMNYNL